MSIPTCEVQNAEPNKMVEFPPSPLYVCIYKSTGCLMIPLLREFLRASSFCNIGADCRIVTCPDLARPLPLHRTRAHESWRLGALQHTGESF